MFEIIKAINQAQRKAKVVDVRSGDNVRVHQKIKEGNKERVQVFEGVVIRTDRKDSHTSSITVRRIASGVGVEKTYLLHSPLVLKVEVTKRSKVRRKYLSYLRKRSGKSARLTGVDFDRNKVNAANKAAQEEIEHLKEELAEHHDEYAKEEAAELKAAAGDKK
ncbi:MAG TPA: 50S ribosomal protein L19 [Candidatus Saccharimonas sp.]|nr:50S ribosomal protein L19 [Candidatus Saccharimonas sp.]